MDCTDFSGQALGHQPERPSELSLSKSQSSICDEAAERGVDISYAEHRIYAASRLGRKQNFQTDIGFRE
jgi:hypothetical protein